jgi:hypothetical protein
MNETSEGTILLSEIYGDEREKVRRVTEELIASNQFVTSAEVARMAKVSKRSTAGYLDANWKEWELVRRKAGEHPNARWIYAKDATKIPLNL